MIVNAASLPERSNLTISLTFLKNALFFSALFHETSHGHSDLEDVLCIVFSLGIGRKILKVNVARSRTYRDPWRIKDAWRVWRG